MGLLQQMNQHHCNLQKLGAEWNDIKVIESFELTQTKRVYFNKEQGIYQVYVFIGPARDGGSVGLPSEAEEPELDRPAPSHMAYYIR